MASSGTSFLRDRRQSAPPIAQREGQSGPPLHRAIGRWAATAVLALLFASVRSLNLCAVVMLGLVPLLTSSPVGQFVRHSLTFVRLVLAPRGAVARLEDDEQLSEQHVERSPVAGCQPGEHALVPSVVGVDRLID
jgi:hypothetical protein